MIDKDGVAIKEVTTGLDDFAAGRRMYQAALAGCNIKATMWFTWLFVEKTPQSKPAAVAPADRFIEQQIYTLFFIPVSQGAFDTFPILSYFFSCPSHRGLPCVCS